MEQTNNLSLFHKLILLDLTDMFNKIVDKLDEKFNKKSLQKESLDSNRSNTNAKSLLSLEEKSTYE